MNYNKMTVKDVPLSGKKVLLRCDFNVPQDKTTGEITSDKRIVAALPTIRYLLDNGAAVIACSHLGKPKGTWKESLTLALVAKRLSELLGMEVLFAKDIIGEDAKAKAAALQPGQLLLLENLRFDPREEKNDPEFAKEDVFSLLDNLLKWTKSQIGKLNVVYQDVDLVEVTDGVIEIFSMVASLKKIRIREMKPEKMMVNADIDMLKTVVRNLLSNAIKFSKENSEVLVKMEEVDGMAVVSVQDYGCGISEEGQKKLLHTDTHFSTFGTNNEEGSGLGLLLCKDFVVKNGGKLWFTSKEGEGSIFSFSIPVKK